MQALPEKRFFQLVTLLPVAVPLVVGSIAFVRNLLDPTPRKAGPIDYAVFVVFFSLPIGFVPYALVVVPMFIWLRDRPAAYYRWAVLTLPMLFTGVLTIMLLALALVLPTLNNVLFEFAAYGLTLGYVYVAVAFAARACFARAGCVSIGQRAA